MSHNKMLVRFWHFPTLTLGPGRRLGIWLQGCSIHCKGCIAPENQEFDESFAVNLDDFINEIEPVLHEALGVTISGGEPLDQPESLLYLLEALNKREIYDILLYSGYKKEKVLEIIPEIPDLIAALIDGPFIEGAATNSIWKGSENQTLTIFNENYREIYTAWSIESKRNIQLVNNETGCYLIGIPKQNDNWINKFKSGSD